MNPHWHSLAFQALLLIKPTSQFKVLSCYGPKDNDTQIFAEPILVWLPPCFCLTHSSSQRAFSPSHHPSMQLIIKKLSPNTSNLLE